VSDIQRAIGFLNRYSLIFKWFLRGLVHSFFFFLFYLFFFPVPPISDAGGGQEWFVRSLGLGLTDSNQVNVPEYRGL